MRKWLFAWATLAVAGAMIIGGSPGKAQLPLFPTVARSFSAWLVRAYDPCTPGGLTVTTSGLPSQGCLATATSVDDQMTMEFAKIVISKKSAKIAVIGRGLIPGGRVKVQLTVRTTRNGISTKHPPGTKRVTFQDTTVVCGPAPFGFIAVWPSGKLLGKIDLSECLQPYPGLATGNIEVVDVALLNADNSNRVFARPGVMR